MKVRALELSEQIGEYQNTLHDQQKHKFLIVPRGLNTSGKDETVKILIGLTSPAGMRSVRFKVPTAFEWAHEFLWRIHKNVPATGERAVFNRSHTEDLLITKVHGLIDESEVQRRCQHINAFERMLVETSTTISKFFLHISKDEQQIRLQERLNDPNKHWKFDRQDQVERSSWDAYQAAYQATIPATHQDFAPWYIFPSNSKTQRNLIVAGIVAEKLVSMGLNYPALHSDYFQITLD